MAKCKDCFHCEICAKQNRLVQIDAHTWDEYELLDDVEKFCEHFKNTADVVPRAEVAREIFEELTKSVISKLPMKIRLIFKDDRNYEDGFRDGKGDALIEVLVLIDDLKKKYTEGQK